jgi:hydroxymethylpyrimidine/phosphomethylpyrimidine kinase
MSLQLHQPRPVALSIAGLDPSGGAGVIADIRVFASFGCFPAAAITSVTFQNAEGVSGAEHLSAETVRRQVMAIIGGNSVACAKTGMLPTRDVVREVARLFRDTRLPAPIVDPVINSTSGYALIDEEALEEMVKELFPLARLVTPNIPEAERLTGLQINDEKGMLLAAEAIRKMGAPAVLIKGGHLGSRLQEGGARQEMAMPIAAVDVLDDEGRLTVFREARIRGAAVRGTGCMLSAAIAAELAQGTSLGASVGKAKKFVTEAIRRAQKP